ncbi:hypothetical protein BJ322DRAFT_1109331 [Thelephora terrestris]|uniref:F-box domain-containing protein n=1 Tax=Thelephora terrestris TaxID=56493 RepID=A0A9P6HDS4_9AGAM|nr:hypothetical protein BJ322DRAFT_1109331 [Thelephora terrestris]
MSSDAARDLSIPELLCVLNEKLYLECNRLREYRPPPAVSTASLETEIRSLETRAQEVLSLIPSLRNLLQPVNRLPPEILSRIAQCLLHDGTAVDTRPIIPLTHVCRYWRSSITSDSANWTLISDLDEGLTELTLERAKTAPLQVTLQTPSPCCVPTPYIQSIDTLRYIKLVTMEKLRQAVPGFPRSTPNLRLLRLNSAVGAVWDRSVDPFESLTPTLRCLQLSEIPLYPAILQLRSLTELVYSNPGFDLPLDTLLDFLEGNHSLKHVILNIVFRTDSLRCSRRQTPARNQLQRLSIFCRHAMDAHALISGIALQRGADLAMCAYSDAKLNDILSGVSPTHLLNARSPTHMLYRSYPRTIGVTGPNGKLSLCDKRGLTGGDPFEEFPFLSLTHVQSFHLLHRVPENVRHTLNLIVFDQSPFPALETLAVDCETSVSHLLSALFSNPSSPHSLTTLIFVDCDLDEEFMEQLTRYASDRRGTTSAWLHQVKIVNLNGVFPSVASIHRLRKLVPLVEVKMGD